MIPYGEELEELKKQEEKKLENKKWCERFLKNINEKITIERTYLLKCAEKHDEEDVIMSMMPTHRGPSPCPIMASTNSKITRSVKRLKYLYGVKDAIEKVIKLFCEPPGFVFDDLHIKVGEKADKIEW